MPAATTDNLLVLPRIARPDPATAQFRPVHQIATGRKPFDGWALPRHAALGKPAEGLEVHAAALSGHRLRQSLAARLRRRRSARAAGRGRPWRVQWTGRDVDADRLRARQR